MSFCRQNLVAVRACLALVILAAPGFVTFHLFLCEEQRDDAIPAISACNHFDAPCGIASKTDPTKVTTSTVFDPTTSCSIDVSLPAVTAAFADALSIVSFSSQDHSLQQLSIRLQI
jgi:hypothetical protein